MKKGALFFIILFFLFSFLEVLSQTTSTFNYTGSFHTWTVPDCVYSINVTVKGASGGGNNAGQGATVTGTLNVAPGQVLRIYVGGAGNCPNAGGFNGGGNGASANTTANAGCGGGGASDIRVTPFGLNNRLVVASGGGGMGGGDTDAFGGDGGCATGGEGTSPFGVGGNGGTQTTGGAGGPPWISSGNWGFNGALGVGGNGATDPCYNKGPGGGAGGGFYGGGGGGSDCYSDIPLGGGGGGGGSSLTPAGGNCTAGNNTGHGSVVIAYNPNPIAGHVTATPATICAGQTTSLSVSGHNGTIQWQSSTNNGGTWTNISGATNTNYTTPALNANSCYRVAITCGTTVHSNMVCITVNPIPVATATPTTQTICTGETSNIALSSNITNTTFNWTVNQSGTSGASNGTGSNIVQTLSVTGTNVGTATYTITPTANGCAGQPITVTLTVQPTPTITLSATTQNVCPGQSTTITATGASNYTWSSGLGSGSSHTVTPVATTTYSVTAANTYGCSATNSIVVTLHPNPTVNISPAAPSICHGQITTIEAAGAQTYLWSTSQTTNAITAQPSATTTYTVTGTSNMGCTGTSSVVVTVHPLPTANAGNAQTICSGHSAQLLATGGTSYAWTPSTGLNNANIANPLASPVNTTTYTVVVTDGNNCTASGNVVVNVNALPPANAGTDQIICVGQSVNLTAFGGTTYAWSNNTQTQSINVSPTTTTTYTVTVTDANGCSHTDDVVVNVNMLPPVNAGSDAAICIGNSTQLNATGGLSYVWSPTTGLNSTTVTNPTANPTVTTTYTVIATDANGCTASDNMILTVHSLPLASAGNDDAICIGNSTQLNAGGGTSYVWSPGSGLSNPNIANPLANPTTTTTYTVTVTDAQSCTATDAMILTVHNLPLAHAGANATICLNDTTHLIASGGVAYMWSPATGLSSNSVANPLAYPQNTTTYTVTATDANGCSATDNTILEVMPLPPAQASNDTAVCFGTQAFLNASGGVTYSWSPQSTLSNSSTNNPIANPQTTTTYTVTVTDNFGCSQTDNVTVTVLDLPPAHAGNNTAVCEGHSTQLTASGGAGYIWCTGESTPTITVSPLVISTYTVIVTDQHTCSAQATVIVSVHNPPLANAGQDFSICLGDHGQLNASGGVSYQWSPATGLSSINIPNPTANPTSTTTYTVTVTDGHGCSATDNVVVDIFFVPNVEFNANVYNGCLPLTVSFFDLTPPTVSSWLWNFGDNYAQNNTSNVQNPTHTYEHAGTYSVTLSIVTADGCPKSMTYNNIINVYPNPVAAFTPVPGIGTVENPFIDFMNESSGAVSWHWNFGNPSSGSDNYSTDHSPTHAYYNEGVYIVTLSVQSAHGCVDSTMRQVKIVPEFSFYIPNAFTPNGDGINDYFRAYGESIIDYKMFIFNRWGDIVFEADNISMGWNGRCMRTNEIMMQGVYVYKVLLKDIRGKEHRYIGKVTLLGSTNY